MSTRELIVCEVCLVQWRKLKAAAKLLGRCDYPSCSLYTSRLTGIVQRFKRTNMSSVCHPNVEPIQGIVHRVGLAASAKNPFFHTVFVAYSSVVS